MTRRFRHFGRTALLAAAVAVAVVLHSGAAVAGCLGGNEARSVIASGEVLPMGRIVGALRQRYRVDVVDGQLCEGGGGYVYRLTILTPRGKVRKVTVDARTGRPRGGDFD